MAMLKISAIQERYLTIKVQTLHAQVIELNKFKYDKIQKSEIRRGSDKLFEEALCPLYYE